MIDTGLHGVEMGEDAALADTVEVPAAQAIAPTVPVAPGPPGIVLSNGSTCNGISAAAEVTWESFLAWMSNGF